MLDAQRFQSMGVRGALSLNALKLYFTLITFRDNASAHVLLSYDKIEQYTGIPRRDVRRAIDVLLNHEWIAITSRASTTAPARSTTVYVLRGDFWGRRPSNYVRAALTAP